MNKIHIISDTKANNYSAEKRESDDAMVIDIEGDLALERLIARLSSAEAELDPDFTEYNDTPTTELIVAIPAPLMQEPIVPVPTPDYSTAIPSEAELSTSTRKPEPVDMTSKAPAFPIADISIVRQFDNPVGSLSQLSLELSLHGDYDRVRDEYCHLSIRLNLIGKIAPAYRQQLKSGQKGGHPSHMAIHRDQLVIDSHWLQTTGVPALPEDRAYRPLFDPATGFPFDLAWLFANKKWKATYRADEALNLTTFQQHQLAKLHNQDIADRRTAILTSKRSPGSRSASPISIVRSKVNKWAEKDPRIQPMRDEYVHLWRARELLGHDAPMDSVAKLHALMTGTAAISRKTVTDKLKRLDACLASV